MKILEATLTLEYKDMKTADAVAKAIYPDNFKTPKGLKVDTFAEGNKVVTSIKYEGRLGTFIATINDLLFCASTAERTLDYIASTKSKD